MTKLQPQRSYGLKGLILLASMLLSLPAAALEMEFLDGDITLSTSHSLTVGANYALKDGSDKIIYRGAEECPRGDTSCGDGGKNSGPNDHIGHTNYDKGVWSSQFKGTTDIEATWGEFGAFTRLLYFYDHEVMNQPRETRPSTFEGKQFAKWDFADGAKKEIGRDIRTLDAYLSWETYVFDKPLSIKVGDQVINWGQSTFLPGIGLTNPVDLVRLFSPGFELRELFKPVGLATVSFGLSENINLEAYYQYKWAPVNLPPGGSFMAVNNYTGEGLNDSGIGHVCLDGSPIAGTADEGGWCVPANKRRDADDGDEFGFRLTWTVPALNYTQFDFYAVRYHNRLPVVGAEYAGILPNQKAACDIINGNLEGDPGIAAALGTAGSSFEEGLGNFDPILNPLDAGVDAALGVALTAAGVSGIDALDLAGIVANCFDEEAPYNEYDGNTPPYPLLNAEASVAYVEDLWAYGFSWAGNLPGGWSFQGEMSLKKDFPIQYALPELISAAVWLDLDGAGGAIEPCALRQLDVDSGCNDIDLGTLLPPGAVGLPHNLECDPNISVCDGPGGTAGEPGEGGTGVSTAFGLRADTTGSWLEYGSEPRDVFQAQFTLIKLFPQMLGGDTLTFVFEGIWNKVLHMPDDVQFEKPDFTDFNSVSRADDDAWGYRILLMNEYSGLFGTNWNFKPILAWFHDVKGSQPANIGTFLEGRRQMIFAGVFEWNQYKVIGKYAYFGGAKDGNIWQDRDSVSLTFQMGI